MGEQAATDQLSAYLRVLAGGAPPSAFLELRYRVGDDAMAAEFVPVRDRQALVKSIQRRARTNDVYVGCAPRARRSGTKNDIAEVWVLWAECDGAAAARAACAYSPSPSVVIRSGSGPNVHAYWPLREPLRPPDAEAANLRLAVALGADRACFDAGRILRPPCTWNHKRQPPTRVSALRLDETVRFDPAEVIARAPAIEYDWVDRRWQGRVERDSRGDPLLRIAPTVYVSDLLGVVARPGRKVPCPFHTDERPSLHVYPSAARGWSCFSCGRGGSIYDLGAAVWGIGTRGRDFVALRRRLTERFSAELSRGLGVER